MSTAPKISWRGERHVRRWESWEVWAQEPKGSGDRKDRRRWRVAGAGDRAVVSQGTGFFEAEGGLGTDWAQKCCGKISLHGLRAVFIRGKKRGWSTERSGDSLGTGLS